VFKADYAALSVCVSVLVRQWSYSGPVPSPPGGFRGLSFPNKGPSPQKLNYEALKIGEVFVKFQNVKPPYWKLSGDGSVLDD